MAVASVAMRHILVDRARRRAAHKRGGREQPVLLDDAALSVDARAEEILAIDEALTASRRALELSGSDLAAVAYVQVQAGAGERGPARELLRVFRERPPAAPVSPVLAAHVAMAAGEHETALS
ncbi:MAG TPA: ECF-type sigma factor [Thermoanaerobaculia bacterium]|jgi:hypothetical protein